MRRTLAVAVLTLAGCGGSAGSGDEGFECRVSKPRTLNAEIGPGLGSGPAYPVGFDESSVMDVVLPPPDTSEFRGSEWGGQKTLWAIRPGTTGPLTVRGKRLDAPGEVRFNDGKLPPKRLEIGPAHDAEWIYTTSYTRIREHGCYAFILEGEGVREEIVFRAGRRSDY